MESIRFQALREEKSPSFRLHVRRLNPLVHSFPPPQDRMDRRFSSAICSQKIIVPSIIKMSEFLSLAGRARTRFADDSTRFQCVRWPRARPRAARRMAGGLRPPSLIRALHARCVKPLPGKAILTSVRCSCAVDRGASEFAQIAISAQGFAAGANRFGVLERDSPSKMLDLERTSRFGNEKSPFNNRIGEIRESSALNAPLFPCRNRSERMQDPRSVAEVGRRAIKIAGRKREVSARKDRWRRRSRDAYRSWKKAQQAGGWRESISCRPMGAEKRFARRNAGLSAHFENRKQKKSIR